MQVDVQLLRGRGYPQLEEEPYPCTTQVIVSILSPNLKTKLENDQSSSIQKNSNEPFYNDDVKFIVPNGDSRAAVVLAKIMKFSQEDKSYPLFYGKLDINFEKYRFKKEVIIPLSLEDPTGSVSIDTKTNPILINAENQHPSLSVRVRTQQVAPTIVSEESEILAKEEIARLCSDDILVPANSKFLWIRFLLDRTWTNLFRFHLLATWRNYHGLKSTSQGNGNSHVSSRGLDKNGSSDLQTIGDVVIKKWRCSRIHVALTRLFLTAEKYCRGETNLLISNEEEEIYWSVRKHRSSLLSSLWYDSLQSYGKEGLRDSLESLWILFAAGIDYDSNSQKSLSYALRMKVYNATFDECNAVLLLSSLMHHLIPSISYESAQGLAIDDLSSKNAFRGFILEDSDTLKKLELESRITSHQIFFFAALSFFIAPLMDTITETESTKALKLFKAAIADAHKRSSNSNKEFIKGKMGHDLSNFRGHAFKGDGISIEHLDKLGHRKIPLKFK